MTGARTSPLDRGDLRARVAAGEKTVGTFVGTASAVTAEACAAAGVDWLVLDLEHGAGGEDLVGAVVRFADLRKRRTQLAVGGGLPRHLEARRVVPVA